MNYFFGKEDIPSSKKGFDLDLSARFMVQLPVMMLFA